jgi:GNAT superfamily N-acetyltransferase
MPVAFRPATEVEMPFVFSTWLKNFKESAQPHQGIQGYYTGQHRLIELLAARGASLVLACNREAPEQLLGWVCCEGNTVHYLYVKQVFRRLGIGRKLLSEAGIRQPFCVTHWTPCVSLLRAKAEFTFDPYLLIER